MQTPPPTAESNLSHVPCRTVYVDCGRSPQNCVAASFTIQLCGAPYTYQILFGPLIFTCIVCDIQILYILFTLYTIIQYSTRLIRTRTCGRTISLFSSVHTDVYWVCVCVWVIQLLSARLSKTTFFGIESLNCLQIAVALSAD